MRMCGYVSMQRFDLVEKLKLTVVHEDVTSVFQWCKAAIEELTGAILGKWRSLPELAVRHVPCARCRGCRAATLITEMEPLCD